MTTPNTDTICPRCRDTAAPDTPSRYDHDVNVCTTCATRERRHRGDIIPFSIRLATADARALIDAATDPHATMRPVSAIKQGDRIQHQGRSWTVTHTTLDHPDEIVTLHLQQPGDPKATLAVPYHESRRVWLA